MGRMKLLVMDVDGTLTDGRILIGMEGEAMKAFHVQDGYGIVHILPKLGITPVIITGRSSEIVTKRAAELGIIQLYQGVAYKLEKLKEIAVQMEVAPEEIAYIGDDLNDLECIHWCGCTACPADAVPQVSNAVDYICRREGGRGAVREFIDWLSVGK